MNVDGRKRDVDQAETSIVYVDDDPSVADEVVGALREELPSAAIRHVDGAAQLLEAGLDHVDCVVSADQLTETAGVNLVRAVREITADVPVLLYGDPENSAEISAAFDAGATDYLQRVGDGASAALARKVAALVDLAGEPGGSTEDGAGAVAEPPAESLPSEEYRVIAEVASDAIVTIDQQSRIHYANPAVGEVFGYEPEELIGERLTELMPDEFVESHREGIRRYIETGERELDWSYLELPGERRDGTEIPLSVSFGEFERNGRRFFSGIMRDISDQKELEADLREERNLNQRIVETSPIGIVTLDADGRFTSANERAAEILGRSREQIEEMAYDDAEWELTGTDGEPLPKEETAFGLVIETGESVYNVEFGVRHPDGERTWISVSGSPLTEDGEVTGAVLAIEDVTAQKALQEDLREERNLNRQIVETSPVGIMIADRNGTFTFSNEHAERILGKNPDAIDDVSASVSDLDVVGTDGVDLPDDEMPFARVIETGKPVYEVEIGLERPDGERVWVLLNAAPMLGGDGDVTDVVFAFQNVTERKRLASELQEVYGRVTDAFYALDDQWRITHVNDRAEELIDYQGEGLVGKNLWDVFEWGADSKLGEEYREAMATQEPTSFEFYYPEPLDAWYEVNAYPSETGLSVYFRDVTERKERERALRETKDQLQALIELLPVGVFVAEADGELVEWNDAAEEIWGGEVAESQSVAEYAEYSGWWADTGEPVAPEEWPIARALRGEEVTDPREIEIEAFDGERRTVLHQATPIRDADGEVRRAVVTLTDITERKERERDLELFRTLLDRTTDSVLVIDPPTGEFLDVNETACRQLGYDRDELTGMSVHDVDRLFADIDDWRSHVEDLKDEVAVTIEGVHERKDGTTYPAEVNVTYVELDREYMVAVARDITERRRRERRLRESRQRYRTLVDNFPNGAVALVDQEMRYVTFGGTPESTEGLSSAEIEGKHIRDALPDELADAVIPGYEAALGGETARYEDTIGDEIYQFHFIPVRDDDGTVDAAIGMSQDVTERRKHERALREERDLNERILETTPVGIVTLDADGKVDLINGRVEEVLGYSPSEFDDVPARSGMLDPITTDGEPLTPDDAPATRVFVGGEQLHDVEIGVMRADGERVWFSVSGTPLRDEDGDVSGAVMTFADITDRREREQALRERERQLERYAEYTDDVLDAVDDVFYILDRDGSLQRWNESLTEVTGYSDAEIESMQSLDFFEEDEHERISDAIADSFETGSTRVEAELLTKSGDRIPYEFQASALEDPEGEPVIAGIGRDITDRKEREAELEKHVRQQQTLAELKRTALEDIDIDDLFEMAVERVADVLDHEYCTILERQLGGDELLLRTATELPEDTVGSATIGTDELSQAGYTLRQGAPVVVENLAEENRFEAQTLEKRGVVSGISVAVGPRDNPWGVLGTHTTERREYADHEIEFVEHVAHLLATTIQRKRYEDQLSALNDVTRLLMEAESPEAVGGIVADAADGELDLPIAVVGLYDDQTGALRPAAATSLGEAMRDETDLFDVEDGIAWDAFVNDERRTDAPDERIELSSEPVYLRERIALPLGKHGVLLVGVAGEGTMAEPQLDFVETVAATVRAALDRADREETLRDREAALQSQNEDLERLARLNEVVRGIERALVGASTRSEIETAVCEQLATVEPYGLAWIGRPDSGRGRLRRVAAAGDDGYLADVDLSVGGTDDPEPSVAAGESGEIRAVEHVHAEPPLSGWRQAALGHGFSSAVSVPLEYGGYRYGVLTVYGTRTNLFDERERETLVDLGDTIAYAINAVESKRALVGDEVVELELELHDPDAFVFQFLAESGGRFEFENVFLQEGPGMRALFSADGVAPEAMFDYADRSPFIEELRQITEDEPPLYECTLTEAGFIPRLFDHGARPQEITATGDGMNLVVELPATVDVRGFVEMLESLFDHVELLARRERTLETRSRREFQAELDAELTDRQREVLRTAYFGGFFETPRRRTGKEIGESLDISQPTFNHHLRAAQRKLFELLYGSADAGADAA